MQSFSRNVAATAALVLASLLPLTLHPGPLRAQAVTTAPAATIPWRPDVSFTRTSVDDDVRSVLRGLLGAHGLSVIFRPGISARVSFRFRDADPAAVFDQLIAENGLEAAFNPATSTVTIGPARATAAAATPNRRFIPLRDVNYQALRQMLTNFGIGAEGISYDATTSMLGVTGDAQRIAQVSELVRALDEHFGSRQDRSVEDRQRAVAVQRSDLQRRTYEDAMNTQVRVFRLRFADVASTTRQFNGRSVTVPGVLDTLQAMLGLNNGAPAEGPRSAVPSNFRPASPIAPGASGSPLRQMLTGGAGGVSPGGGGASSETEGSLPALSAIGRLAISVDQRTNSVVVRGSPAAIQAVEEVIRQIDQPVKMVQIEVVIATAELGVSEEIGIAFRGATRRGGAFDTGSSGGRADPTTGFNPVSLLPVALGPQATVASFVVQGGQAFLQTQLRALAQRNRARILSSPHLVTLDNITARITRAEDLYVPVDTGGLNGQGLSQIQTGLTLEITPSIVPAATGSREQLVRLSLNAVNSAPTQGTGSRISVRSQEVQTDVLVPDGGTFVVGGLFDDTRLVGRSGIPILGDIPVLGALFRESRQEANLGETIFFITPRVVDQRETFARDIAQGADAVAHVRDQKRVLAGTAREMDGRPSVRGLSRFLEEDQ